MFEFCFTFVNCKTRATLYNLVRTAPLTAARGAVAFPRTPLCEPIAYTVEWLKREDNVSGNGKANESPEKQKGTPETVMVSGVYGCGSKI
ncbi:hypothetical protein KL86CLO1_12948 [uncultured Eubacteriales bacterium]|uniref:Uncharacterized protein n=1 Tax=uncultured Eubacteriales bacterium TaxID=172733 RepID=A0A212KFH9_9FIRM|nr:hypothetical protein KL86CLO1_12948 [uncultured Eubacteriales bacterium]